MGAPMSTAAQLIAISARLRDEVERLTFSDPVTCVYDPLDYAWSLHEAYLRRFGEGTGRIVLVGMNPGPFGMVQTGVPFGEVTAVRDFLGLRGEVGHPPCEHPKRPVHGLACARSEVSGKRLWGWAREAYGTAEAFFERFFVLNYCPLCFVEASGRNRTPDKLPAVERAALFSVCDRALADAVDALAPTWVIGIGAFAEGRARLALADRDVPIGRMLHPSPASPAANRGWQQAAERDLRSLGIAL
jgi:single-strand selective monofunctional uracil DNA glycosylase